MNLPESAAAWFDGLIERLRRMPSKPRIVFPEADDPRVRAAAERLAREGIVEPVPIRRDPKHAAHYYARRKAKGVTESQAREMAAKPLYAAALMVATGDADGFVGGAANTTGETVRAALRRQVVLIPDPAGSSNPTVNPNTLAKCYRKIDRG